mgnify:CR=1 FL=1
MDTPFEIHPKDALPALHNPAYVWVDVREEHEWDYGHLPGIQHLPMSSLTGEEFSRFSKDQKMIIVCRTGSRSRSVTHALREMGFIHAQNLAGGMIGMNTVLEKHIPVLMH